MLHPQSVRGAASAAVDQRLRPPLAPARMLSAVALASTARAESAAEGFLDQTAADLLTGRDVTVSGAPSSIEVTVSGTSISLFPGMSGWSVTQTAVGPVERPTP